MPRPSAFAHFRSIALACALPLGVAAACSRSALPIPNPERGSGGAGGASTSATTSSNSSATATTSSSVGVGGSAPDCPVATEPVLLAPAGATAFLTIDDAFVYFTDISAGTVSKVPLCGGEITTIATLQEMPLGIALDATNVYWVNQGKLYATGSIVTAPKSGGAAVTLATNQAGPWPVAVDANAVYWSTHLSKNSTWRLPLGGGSPIELTLGAGFAGLALDDDYVYWAYDTVGRVAKTGGEPEIYANMTSGIGWCVAVDDTDVYWTTYVGALQKAPKAGGAVTTLTPSGYQRCLALDATHVYFTQDAMTDPGVLRVPKAGGPVEHLATDAATSIAVDSQNIYWKGAAGIMRMSK